LHTAADDVCVYTCISIYQNRFTVCLNISMGKAMQATILCTYLDSMADSLEQDDALTIPKQLKSTHALLSTHHDVSFTIQAILHTADKDKECMTD